MSSKFIPIIVVSGASGSGKTSLCRMVADHLRLFFSISHTTRSIRPGEVNGRDYHFVDRAQFDMMVQKGDFLEWEEVYGNCYGTSKAPIEAHLARGEGVILDVDTKGALRIKKMIPEAFLVFIKAPSLDELKKRLSNRGSETQESMERRLSEALKEESFQNDYDTVLINHDLGDAFEDLSALIQGRFPHLTPSR